MTLSISRAAGVLLAGMLAAGALPVATPALAATQEEFLAACLAVAGADSTELCGCKAEQAAKLADEEMLGFIITRMADPEKFSTMVKEGEVPEDVMTKWPYYVRDSNAVCLAEQAVN